MRWKIVANFTITTLDETTYTPKQKPTFWVEALNEREAKMIALDILGINDEYDSDDTIYIFDINAVALSEEQPAEIDPEEDEYAQMTQDDFNRILEKQAHLMSADDFMTLPGVWEIVSEHLNNDVLDEWKEEQSNDDD